MTVNCEKIVIYRRAPGCRSRAIISVFRLVVESEERTDEEFEVSEVEECIHWKISSPGTGDSVSDRCYFPTPDDKISYRV